MILRRAITGGFWCKKLLNVWFIKGKKIESPYYLLDGQIQPPFWYRLKVPKLNFASRQLYIRTPFYKKIVKKPDYIMAEDISIANLNTIGTRTYMCFLEI